MATEIKYQTWSGGSGQGDLALHVLDCREDPDVVLSHLLKTHEINYALGSYSPVDRRYPNNVTGLVLHEIPGHVGEVISKHGPSIHDFDLVKITGYNPKLAESRDKIVFEDAVARQAENLSIWALGVPSKLDPLCNKNYLLERDSEYVKILKNDEEKLGDSNSCSGAEFIRRMEEKLNNILKIGRIILNPDCSIPDLKDLLVKYYPPKVLA